MVEDIGEDFEEEGEGEEEETISATLESFTEFFKEFEDENGNKRYFEAIKRLSLEDKRSLEIDLMDLITYDSELADQLHENPDNYIPYAKAAIKELVKIEDPSHAERVKEFHARFFNSTERVNLRALRAIHLGKLISIDGILTRVTIVKPLLIEGVFKCGFCGEEVYIEQERGRFTKPSKCPNPTCLKSGTFKLLQEESKYIDWQKITLQERPEELPPGQIPRSIDATLLDDLVDIARPGDRITVTGILRAFPDFTRRGIKLATFHTYLDLLQLKTFGKEYEEFEINAEEEEQIKELARDPFIHQKITKSIAPSIYGYEAIKEAVALLLFGGLPKVLPDGIKIRGESNLLLIGDPGVAKCVAPGTRVIMGSGEVKNIEQIVEDALKDNINEIDDGFYAKGSQPIITMDKNGKAKLAYANIFWKRKAPEYMYEVKTSSVKEIIVTPTHPFFITKNGLILSKEAKELEIGDFIATPRYIPSSPNDKIDIKFEKGKTNAKHIYVPRKVTKELARFLGYICGDGCVQRTKTACTWFTNNERQILTDYINCAKESFGNINYNIRPSRPRKSARDIYISSIELGRFLENTSPSFYKGAENKQVPSIIMRSPNGTVSEFLKAYYDTDGYVDKNRATISVSSSSKRLLSDIQLLLNRFEIISQLGYSHSRSQSSDKKRYNRLKITSIDQFNRFKDKIGLNSSKKEKLNKNLSSNTNIDIIPSLKDLLLELRKKRNLTQSQMGLARSTYQHYERGDRNPSRTNLKVIIKELEKYGDNDKLNQLRTIADTDVFWDKIISIQKIKPDFEWVYDLQVPETHNFVANGIYVHNSQLLKYVSATAPRALYTSGKGSTAAGLTAAVLRDSDTGDFILEAGALVLADRGVACIDEFDKMEATDRVAIHEAMEQHTISIAKAGIVATLNARTSILAAANPAFGRYDAYRTPAENIKLPVTILSRFDLIFIMTDIPESAADRALASHILKLHQTPEETAEPPIIQDLLRKYISYARKNIHPILSEEAVKRLEDYYVQIRSISESKKTPIAITARQLESLIRLAESRARMAFRDVVTLEDAEASIQLVQSSLQQVGIDQETGMIDIDTIMTGKPMSIRTKMEKIIDILSDLEPEYGKEVPLQKLQEEAIAQGIDEKSFGRIMKQLKDEGMLYEPKTGYIGRVGS